MATVIARNFLVPMDEILLKGRYDEEVADDSMAFRIQSVASVSNLARRLLARENKALSKLVGLYYKDMQTKLDMLQSSNEKILEDQERLMVKVKRSLSPSPEWNLIDFIKPTYLL
ncbi:unnamed protein product [Prunus armeniaca]